MPNGSGANGTPGFSMMILSYGLTLRFDTYQYRFQNNRSYPKSRDTFSYE